MIGFHPRTLNSIIEIRRHQRESEQVLQKIQLQRLKAITRYAFDNVPYYHRLFRENDVRPGDIKRLKDIRKIPITEKKDIRDAPADFIAKHIDIADCKRIKSSGSTGEPVTLLMDRWSEYYSQALFWYALYEMGHRWQDKIVKVSGSSRDVSSPRAWKGILDRVKGLRRRTISIFHSPRNLLKEMDRPYPYSFYAFASVIETLANALKDGAELKWKPRIIFSHGETLTEPARQLIEKAFERKVYNIYGSIEFQRLAFECEEQKGYHMITDCAYLEFLEDGEPVGMDEPGRIVATSFYQNAMPLIRYNQNDIGIRSKRECPCGRSWPLIESIEGRDDDFLTLQSGRRISPRVISLFYDVPGFKKYIMVQEKRDLIVLKIIPNKDYSNRTEELITKYIKKGCYGEDMRVEFELVKELPRDPSGKVRKIISKVT